MYKILHGLDGIPFDELFSYHHAATRSNGYKLYKKFLPPDSRLLMIGIILPKKLSNQIMYGLLNKTIVLLLNQKLYNQVE